MLIVHAGLHKTGSTALQAYFNQASARDLNGKVFGGSLNQVLREGRLTPEITAPMVAAARESDVIVTSEALFGRMDNVYEDAIQRAEDIVRCFGSVPFVVVLYVRPQLDWASSCYSQWIMEGGAGLPGGYAEQVLAQPNLRWSHLIAEIAGVLGWDHVAVRPFPPRGSVVEDFCASQGLRAPVTGAADTSNRSITPAQTALLRCLNDDPARPDRVWGRRALQGRDWGLPASVAYSVFSEQDQLRLQAIQTEDWPVLVEMLEAVGGQDIPAFEAAMAAEQRPIRPFVGQDLSSMPVSEEALQLLRRSLPLALGPRQRRNRLAGLRSQLWHEPAAVPRLVWASIRGRQG